MEPKNLECFSEMGGIMHLVIKQKKNSLGEPSIDAKSCHFVRKYLGFRSVNFGPISDCNFGKMCDMGMAPRCNFSQHPALQSFTFIQH